MSNDSDQNQDNTILNNEDPQPQEPNPGEDQNNTADPPTGEHENASENNEGPDTILAQIKRDDGTQKYSDVPTALNALKESQEFIGQLQSENQQLKQKVEELQEQATKNITMEEILDSLNQNKDKDTDEQPSGESLSPEKIQEFVNQAIEQRETTKTVQQNQQQVADALVKQYGDREKANEFYKQRAQELGVSVDFLNDAAGKSPQAAMQLLGVSEDNQKQSGNDRVEGSVNSEAYQGDKVSEQKPQKSMLSGATTKEVAEEMSRIRRNIEKQLEQ